MITPQYCRTMAQYNAWQNKSLRRCVDGLSKTELNKDSGSFFGSIFGTLNHLLWGDALWFARFEGSEGPDYVISKSTTFTPTAAEWAAERVRLDGRISVWADDLSAIDLVGDVTWFSGSINAEVTRPLATCITHFFNHQTHHRGQLHAMLTAAGQSPDTTDLVFMPER